MKYKIDDLKQRIKNGLKENGFDDDRIKIIINAVELLHNSFFPPIDGLDYDSVLVDCKAHPTTLVLKSTLNNKLHVIGLTIDQNNDIRISDDEDYFALLLSKDRRIAKFKYENDVIYIEGNNSKIRRHVQDYDSYNYVKCNGGYGVIETWVFTNAWPTHKLDIEKLKSDFYDRNDATSYGRISFDFDCCCGYNVSQFEELDTFLSVGIKKRNWEYDKKMKIYEGISKTK